LDALFLYQQEKALVDPGSGQETGPGSLAFLYSLFSGLSCITLTTIRDLKKKIGKPKNQKIREPVPVVKKKKKSGTSVPVPVFGT
jgi:hypothetical protein